MTPDKWIWFGSAGHFICGDQCRFHLCTQIGKYLVSTVGEYLPDDGIREILAKNRRIVLKGMGDARKVDYLNRVGFETMGASPYLYETMVFKAGKPCDAEECHCGLPFPDDYTELDGTRWMTPKEAREGHYAFCEKWSKTCSA